MSLAVAFAFEAAAHFLDPANGTFKAGAGRMIAAGVWYAVLYSALHALFRGRPLWLPALAFALFGSVAEALLFGRFNPIADPVVYALMAYLPFRIARRDII